MRHFLSKRTGFIAVLSSTFWALNSTPLLAGSESYAENSSWPKDSWYLEYEYDDFSDKIRSAQLTFIPQNYGEQKAFFIRCEPYFTNFSVAFIETQEAIKENGKFHNNAEKFSKHGFVYAQERNIDLSVGDQQYHEEVEVGGQTRGLPQWLKSSQISLANDQLQMTFFASFAFEKMPSFLAKQNSDFSRSLYQALKTALNHPSTIAFNLQMPNNRQQRFDFDGQRLKAFAPQTVLDFCLLQRQLRED